MRATSTFILWKLINVQESRYNQPRGELDMTKKSPLVFQLMPKVSFSLLIILCDHNHSLFDFYIYFIITSHVDLQHSIQQSFSIAMEFNKYSGQPVFI